MVCVSLLINHVIIISYLVQVMIILLITLPTIKQEICSVKQSAYRHLLVLLFF